MAVLFKPLGRDPFGRGTPIIIVRGDHQRRAPLTDSNRPTARSETLARASLSIVLLPKRPLRSADRHRGRVPLAGVPYAPHFGAHLPISAVGCGQQQEIHLGQIGLTIGQIPVFTINLNDFSDDQSVIRRRIRIVQPSLEGSSMRLSVASL